MGSEIVVSDLNVYYGSNHALHDVNVVIPEHSITALIGPSGCGKTTFLRSVNRLNLHIPNCVTRGHILLGTVDILTDHVDLRALRRVVGMLFQKPNPFPFSIMENMSLPLRLGGERDSRIIRREARKYLELVGLWDEIGGGISSLNGLELSVGQQQRLCLARALITHPKVLLLDEPCSALDPLSARKIEKLLERLKSDVTIIIATHSLAQARRISDQIVFLLLGEVVETGPTSQVFNTPVDERTRAYVFGDFG
jgi:phosphate transport system ATP-binding protein